MLVNGPFLSGVCSASSPPAFLLPCWFVAAGHALSSGSGGGIGVGCKESVISVVQIFLNAFCTKLN